MGFCILANITIQIIKYLILLTFFYQKNLLYFYVLVANLVEIILKYYIQETFGTIGINIEFFL